MKCTLHIDPSREEEIVIFAHRPSSLTEAVEQLVADHTLPLVGRRDREAVPLEPSAVCCFVAEGDRVYAVTATEKLQLRQRLYQLEERLSGGFLRINQSCLANPRQIDRFEASLGGTLTVIFKGGYRDYVSRRHLKSVKERFGL